MRPLFMEWKRFLPTELSTVMLNNILANKGNWQNIEQQDAAKRAATAVTTEYLEDSSSFEENSTKSTVVSGQGGSRSNPVATGQEEGGPAEMEEGKEEGDCDYEGRKEEDVDCGEEADIVENDVNLAYHYQTDSEQISEACWYNLPPVSEEEQLMLLARNSRRRHSMPVFVRKDLGFYMGLRKDSFSRSNFHRRQSLPATPILTSPLVMKGGAGDSAHNLLSVDGLTTRPKISNLSSSIDRRLDCLSFLPLQNQTRLLQQGGLEPGDDVSLVPHRQSTSCMELRRGSLILTEDSERLRAVLSQVIAGTETCHQRLVGLASSWPSILRAGQKVEQTHPKLLATEAGLISSRTGPHLVDTSPVNSNANSNNNISTCLSTPQSESVALLSRPH